MKRRIILSVIIGIIVIGLMLWINTARQNKREEERLRRLDFGVQMNYVNRMRFESYLITHNADWGWIHLLGFEEIIFVSSAEEALALGFSPNQIVGWPSLYSIAIMEGINDAENADTELEKFGLTYPLTVTDLVENWEQMENLLFAGLPTRDDIIEDANRNYGRASLNAQKARGWLFPGRIEAFNALIEGRDISDFDIEAYNERGWIDRTITLEDLPTWPITEEDVQTDVNLISEIASWLLTDEEYESIIPINMLRSQLEE